MRKLYTVLLGLLLLAGTQKLTAQDEDLMQKTPHAMVAKVLFLDYATPNNFGLDSLSLSNGLEIGYIRNINKYMNLAFPLKVGIANVSGFPNKRRTILSGDAILQLQYYQEDALLVPYIFGGGGVATENFEATAVEFPTGAGVNVRVGKNAYINLQGEYRFSQAENRNALHYGVGYWFRLGAKDEADAVDPKRDTDGDGVPDLTDECPEDAGMPSLLGCPDRDGDGVADKIDACPDVKGTAAFLGCPDSDGDGVADQDDECPEEAGPASNKGCPESAAPVADSDGDGINDSVDKCPNLAGTVSMGGCPDSDGDGIADPDDKCPNLAGPASRNGCPAQDTDGDGIRDDLDDCPDLAGPINLKGCPDTDGDGVVDKDDACPNVAGPPEQNGCPTVDTDGDGIADDVDDCPNVAGLVAFNGCPNPDTDGDGVNDDIDECPNTPGTVAAKGCPDRDGDGVPDSKDNCPDKPGPFNGCPDTDDDGIDDSRDNCPDTAGPLTNFGCPEIKKEEKEYLDFATQAVKFETGKATLKAESYAVLDQVAGILNNYPDYKVSIKGHTDNVGDDNANKLLSQERAKSCYEYLVAKSVSRDRLEFLGLGETKPIATNDTEDGRELNRRVEFELYIKK